MNKHMSRPLRANNGSKTILAKFDKLSVSNLISRAQLAKRKENLINMRNSSWLEMELLSTKRCCHDKILDHGFIILSYLDN
jgi:hypothetical protein